jgi:hypothetical protein
LIRGRFLQEENLEGPCWGRNKRSKGRVVAL